MKQLNPLKLKRLERGLSQYELAYLTKITQTRICYAEKGLTVLKKAQKSRIAKVLKVSVGSLWPDIRPHIRMRGESILTEGEK